MHEFIASLGMLANNLHRLHTLEFVLSDLGAKAQRAGLQPHHLGEARAALVSAMRDTLGQAFTDVHAADWTEALNAAVSVMLRAAGRARAKAA